VDDPLLLLLRFLHYAVLLSLFGLTAFRAFGLHAMDLPTQSGRLVPAFAIAAPLLTLVLFGASVATMMGQPVTAVDWSVIEAIATTTDMGWAMLARCALLTIAIPVILLRARRRWAPAIAAFFYAAALATLPWSGHAAATEGVAGTLHRVNDALHLLAAGYWLGAIGWFAVLALRVKNEPNRKAAGPLLRMMHDFRAVGLTLVGIVAVTGLLNSYFIMGSNISADLLGTPYAQTLAAKVVLVAAMVAAAARHSGVAKHHVSKAGQLSDQLLMPTVSRTLMTELGLGVAVIAAAALLGMLSPMLEPI
jgi:putative copper resistance protein D